MSVSGMLGGEKKNSSFVIINHWYLNKETVYGTFYMCLKVIKNVKPIMFKKKIHMCIAVSTQTVLWNIVKGHERCCTVLFANAWP